MLTEAVSADARLDAEARARNRDEWYIVMPAEPFGGEEASLGPMDEEEVRARLDVYVPQPELFTPPKVLRVVEDYADRPGMRQCSRCGRVMVDRDDEGWYYQEPATTPGTDNVSFMDRVHECGGLPHEVITDAPDQGC